MVDNRNSLFGNAGNVVFDKKNELNVSENKASENKPVLPIQPFSSGMAGFTANNSSSGQSFFPLNQNTTPTGFTFFNSKPVDYK
jgi:hypothetical protein